MSCCLLFWCVLFKLSRPTLRQKVSKQKNTPTGRILRKILFTKSPRIATLGFRVEMCPFIDIAPATPSKDSQIPHPGADPSRIFICHISMDLAVRIWLGGPNSERPFYRYRARLCVNRLSTNFTTRERNPREIFISAIATLNIVRFGPLKRGFLTFFFFVSFDTLTSDCLSLFVVLCWVSRRDIRATLGINICFPHGNIYHSRNK